jgi:hypothetical protein
LTDPLSISNSTTIKMANATRIELLGKVFKMVPPMLESFHKGLSSLG